MKILGAGVALPDGKNGTFPYASDYAVKAARQALAKARCLPSELDLIVGLSVSPSRLANAASIAGPRLGHPVQRDLRAGNAVVFDLLDADWSLALDLTQSHCRQLGYRRALVIRAELLTDVEQAAQGGLSDGAGAIVLAPGQTDNDYPSYADLEAPALLQMHAVPAEYSHTNGFVARLDSLFDPLSGQFKSTPDNVGAAFNTVIQDVLDRIGTTIAELFCESWISSWLPFDTCCHEEKSIAVIAGAANVPPFFQLPAWLGKRIDERAALRPAPLPLMALTLDVFKARLACAPLEI